MPFNYFEYLKLLFLERALGLSKWWQTDEPKLRELLRIKLDENFQPDKIFAILLGEEIIDIRNELKDFANNLQPTK